MRPPAPSPSLRARLQDLLREWWRDGRVLWIALAISVVTHAMLYWMTPGIELAFRPTKVAKYDASLVPIEQIAPAPAPTTAVRQRLRTQSAIPLRESVPAKLARPEADFVAPENSIAVASPSPVVEVANAVPADDRLPAAAASQLPEPATESRASIPAEASEQSLPATAQNAPRRAPAFAERIAIEYKLSTAIADGVASFRWNRRGAAYEIESSIQATGFLAGAFAGVIHQQSKGLITDEGLRPQQFSIRRGEGEAEAAEFKRETNALSLKRNGKTRTLPLTESMQDMQSFLFQLAYDAPHLAENGEKLDIVVTNARKVYRYQFRKLGTETLETRFGAVETIRLLSEAANPEDQYEVWLAPGYFYLPLRLKYYLGRFEVEQLATRVGVSSDAAAR